MITAAKAAGAAARPGLVARRVMRALHLGRAWGQVALWIDRTRPAVYVDDWSGPLISRCASPRVPNPLLSTGNSTGRVLVEASGSPTSYAVSTGTGPIMRCLLVTSSLEVGGVEEVVAFLARRLPSRGLHTAVLCTSRDSVIDGQIVGRTARKLQSEGIEVVGADTGTALEWTRQWRPDVISAHGVPSWAFALAEQLEIPYVDYLHNMNGLIGRDWRWHSEAARSGTLAGVVAVSELLRQQQLAVNPGFPPERVVTIPNGVEIERFTCGDRSAIRDWLGISDEYLFLSLGRHCMQKNSYGLITAFGDVASLYPKAHLVVAGKVDEPRYYRRVAQLREKMPCRDRIHLRDHIQAPEKLLAAADGFVLDSFFEGGPIVSMEALVAGIPVVITDVGNAREQIAGERSRGYVVANPLGDPMKADWASSAAAQYSPHSNREELATAMQVLVANRHEYLANRGRLAAQSATRFNSGLWLARHAAVLRAAAVGAALPVIDSQPPSTHEVVPPGYGVSFSST